MTLIIGNLPPSPMYTEDGVADNWPPGAREAEMASRARSGGPQLPRTQRTDHGPESAYGLRERRMSQRG